MNKPFAIVQLVGRSMRSRGQGRVLLTGSIAGFMPGTSNPLGRRQTT